MIDNLTKAQRRVLDWIRDYMRTHDRAPTLREIGAGLGIRSPNGVAQHLKTLSAKGYIRWQPHAARSLELVSGGRRETMAGVGRNALALIDLLIDALEEMKPELSASARCGRAAIAAELAKCI